MIKQTAGIHHIAWRAQDETLEAMGTELMLPAQYEQHREQLVHSLIPIQVRPIN